MPYTSLNYNKTEIFNTLGPISWKPSTNGNRFCQNDKFLLQFLTTWKNIETNFTQVFPKYWVTLTLCHNANSFYCDFELHYISKVVEDNQLISISQTIGISLANKIVSHVLKLVLRGS